MSNGDRLDDPMAYDVMRETANRVIGRYIAWERAATGDEARHWREARIRTRLEVRAVNPDNRRAVDEKTAEMRVLLKLMPDRAPVLV